MMMEQSMRQDDSGAVHRHKRPRRSREEVSQALIDAAAALLAERSSGHVTVRDIAAKAGVNTTFVHRYFGSKQRLMLAAMERAQHNVAATVEEMPDVVEGAAAVVHATLREREYIAALARATLDGVFDGVTTGSPAMAQLLQRFESELERRGTRSRHDVRVIVACLTAATVGYALFGRYIRHGTNLDEMPDDQVEAALVEVLRDVARLAFRE
jgi:TetR/AcrR family transcriptional regulator, transcriptional repressor of bet genes